MSYREGTAILGRRSDGEETAAISALVMNALIKRFVKLNDVAFGFLPNGCTCVCVCVYMCVCVEGGLSLSLSLSLSACVHARVCAGVGQLVCLYESLSIYLSS